MQKGGGAPAPAPTGCYKCGRPGHWSRDCPSTANPNSASNPNPNSASNPNPPKTPLDKPAAAKKLPRTRPKLTPELLLSDDGLGYVLKHFPRNFKYHGPGHEVADLGNLIGMYAQWHSQLIPYYSFDQFVHKVEQVAGTRRVRNSIQALKERVASGGDPTKLHEPPVEVLPEFEGTEGDTAMAEPVGNKDDPPLESHEVSDIHEAMLDEIFGKATEQEPCQEPGSMASPEVTTDKSPTEGSTAAAGHSVGSSSKTQITEEQLARMEANRLKALERAAARARASAAH